VSRVHEIALCEAIVDAVERRAGGQRVARIAVRVGTAHGADRSAIAEAFGLASAGTLAEGAELDLTLDPVVVRCRRCGHRASPTSAAAIVACPACHGVDVEMLEGDRVELGSVVLAGNAAQTAARANAGDAPTQEEAQT
jgi:hydrogenase nickel incorporation protein HypA/HybF